ncbi:MAG TPA: DUF1501 domain-containing protein [Pirellulales bacterium]|jgi:hypothetical protein|nr:DUF1501 domain-containing protein [Pirellulales bacterium]
MSKPRVGCPGFQQLRICRRSALQIGFCGALGLSLGDLLRGEARAAAEDSKGEGPAKSIIHLHLPGGMAQQESWDPKPEAPVEYRGAFQVVKTSTGEVFSENFARLSKVADKLTIVRSVVGKIPDHGLATYHTFTGYTPSTVIDYPQMGAVVSQHFGPRRGLPPYVAIPSSLAFSGGTGYLSSKYGAFQLGADPGGQGEFKVQDFSLPSGVSDQQFDRRRQARAAIESHLRSMHAGDDTQNTMDEFYGRAYSLVTSAEAQRAFSLAGEPQSMLDLYGDRYILKARREPAGVGKRLLMARRLVEAGVRFVTVQYGAWDSHASIKEDCLDRMPALDHALTGLISDLDDRGLLSSTLVMVTTEFGRTPKINKANGRDHWARVYSLLLAGGGISRGQIYGASDATAAEPSRDAVSLEDFLFTVYHQLGINADEELLAFGTRPIEIIRDGKLVKGIIA